MVCCFLGFIGLGVTSLLQRGRSISQRLTACSSADPAYEKCKHTHSVSASGVWIEGVVACHCEVKETGTESLRASLSLLKHVVSYRRLSWETAHRLISSGFYCIVASQSHYTALWVRGNCALFYFGLHCPLKGSLNLSPLLNLFHHCPRSPGSILIVVNRVGTNWIRYTAGSSATAGSPGLHVAQAATEWAEFIVQHPGQYPPPLFHFLTSLLFSHSFFPFAPNTLIFVL